jgi:hypothetical protein
MSQPARLINTTAAIKNVRSDLPRRRGLSDTVILYDCSDNQHFNHKSLPVDQAFCATVPGRECP